MRALAWGLRLTVLSGLLFGWSWVTGLDLLGWWFYACLLTSQSLLFVCGPSLQIRLLVPLAWLAACWSPPLSFLLALAYLAATARQLGLELPWSRLRASGNWLGLAILTAAATVMSAMGGLYLVFCLSGTVTAALGILAIRDFWGAALDSLRALEASKTVPEWNGYSRCRT